MYAPFLERALYFAQSGDIVNSEKDYATCEKILRDNNMPEESFALLYNNIAKNQLEAGNYIIAKNYLDRISAIRPSIQNPSSYFDAIVCNNIGWASLNMEELGKAEEYFLKAIKTFEKIGSTNTADYLTTLHNLALLYEKKENPKKSVKLYEKVFKSYSDEKDLNGSSRTLFSECYVRTLLASNV